MAIYIRKNNRKIINSTIRIDPGCYAGDRVVRILAAVEKLQVIYVSELIADNGPEEIAAALQAVLHPEQTIKPLSELEREAICNALSLLDGDKEAVANALGIGRSTLYEKLRRYEITTDHALYTKSEQTGESTTIANQDAKVDENHESTRG